MSEKIYKNVNNRIIEMQGKELAYFQKLRDDFKNTPKRTTFDNSIEILRLKRNQLLAQTDYLALTDHTMSKSIKIYRQKLRDITEGVTTVEQINKIKFPKIPTEKK